MLPVTSSNILEQDGMEASVSAQASNPPDVNVPDVTDVH